MNQRLESLLETAERVLDFYDSLGMPHSEGEAELLDDLAAAVRAERRTVDSAAEK